MAPARVLSLGLGVVFLGGGCRPTESASVEPGSDVAAVDGDATPSELPVSTPTPKRAPDAGASADGFMLTLESRCRDVWNGKLVRADAATDAPDAFKVENADTHELQMRPGDALVLTTPHGGIMALEFDNVTTGDTARVEVTSGCTGVKRSVVRHRGL